jgi:hypothetical protein
MDHPILVSGGTFPVDDRYRYHTFPEFISTFGNLCLIFQISHLFLCLLSAFVKSFHATSILFIIPLLFHIITFPTPSHSYERRLGPGMTSF